MKKKINLARAYVVRARGITCAVLKRHGMTNAVTGTVIHVAPATIGRWLDDQTPTFLTRNMLPPSASISGFLSLTYCRPVTAGRKPLQSPPEPAQGSTDGPERG